MTLGIDGFLLENFLSEKLFDLLSTSLIVFLVFFFEFLARFDDLADFADLTDFAVLVVLTDLATLAGMRLRIAKNLGNFNSGFDY